MDDPRLFVHLCVYIFDDGSPPEPVPGMVGVAAGAGAGAGAAGAGAVGAGAVGADDGAGLAAAARRAADAG